MSFVPIIAAFQIQRIRLGILCTLLDDVLFFRAVESGTQLPYNIARNLLLQRDNIATFAAVLLTPNLCVIANVREFGAYLNGISPLSHATRDQRAAPQITADFLHTRQYWRGGSAAREGP
jgi:hypothetical protein